MPLVILHHLLNVFVQLANKRGFKKKKKFWRLDSVFSAFLKAIQCRDILIKRTAYRQEHDKILNKKL
jgi:hypothetical protein